MGMTNDERKKHIRIANMLIGVINDVNTPMLMYQIEKDVAREALENYVKMLEQQPCEDCISRQAVLDNAYAYGNGLEPEGYCVNVEDIQALPSVTPSRPKGKWIKAETEGRFYCSICGGIHNDTESGEWREVFDFKYSYCPNCGADMRESEE